MGVNRVPSTGVKIVGWGEIVFGLIGVVISIAALNMLALTPSVAWGLLVSGGTVAVGIYLLKLRPWARIFALVLAWVGIATTVVDIVTKTIEGTPTLTFPLWSIFVIWFLNRAQTKQQFA